MKADGSWVTVEMLRGSERGRRAWRVRLRRGGRVLLWSEFYRRRRSAERMIRRLIAALAIGLYRWKE